MPKETTKVVINKTKGTRKDVTLYELIDSKNLHKAETFYKRITSDKEVKIYRDGYFCLGKALYQGKQEFPNNQNFGKFRDRHFPALANRPALGSECIRFYLHFDLINTWAVEHKPFLNNPVTLCREYAAYRADRLDKDSDFVHKVRLLTDSPSLAQADKPVLNKETGEYVGKVKIEKETKAEGTEAEEPEAKTGEKGIAGVIEGYRLAANRLVKTLDNVTGENLVEVVDIHYTVSQALKEHGEGIKGQLIELEPVKLPDTEIEPMESTG